jgi:chaperonin cofactor prefoldin
MTTTPGENVSIETRLAVLETQVEAVQEGQRQIIARLDAMQQTNNARLDAMQQNSDARFDSVDARFGSIDTRFDSMNARIDSLNSRFDRLFYTILGLGVAAIGTMIALEKVV